MRNRTIRLALTALAGVGILSCGEGPLVPGRLTPERAPLRALAVTPPAIVISQVYGGGGNAGATYKNDFIELFNPGTSPVNVTGWSVQYASALGTTWSVTNLAGTIPAGAYYLVQEAAGAGGTVNLPTPDATGGINMSATTGKVFLSNTTVALTLACPTSASVVDKVSFGTSSATVSDCGFGVTGAVLTNTTAALRNSSGCAYTQVLSADFTSGAPTPRNSASPTHPCTPLTTVTVTPATATITVGGATQTFTAAEVDASSNPISTTFTWTSSDNAIATVDASGVATAVAAGTATIRATATDGTFGTASLTVNASVQPATVNVTPPSASIITGATQAFLAAAFDATSNPVSTTFTWSSSDNAVATVSASGVATGVTAGTVTITATASNAVFGTASLTVTAPPDHSGEIVISQIYGGGGNAGSTYKNDFIELFNRSTNAVSVTGWSVQRASATGGGWNGVALLSGSIPAGGYYLVQEAAGGGGTVDLPTPDATSNGAMGLASGKVLVAQTTTAFLVACPTGTIVVDIAAYGAGTDCGNSAPAPSNTTADIRKHNGCQYTPNPALDFAASAPTPRNSASPVHSCVPGPLDHLSSITGNASVLVGGMTQLSTEALDANDNTLVATITWSTSDAAVATVSATGLVTGVSASGSPATITAEATVGGITKSATIEVAVTNAGGINWIDLSSSSQSFPPGFQTQLFATAKETQGGAIIPATFTFESVDEFTSSQNVQNTGIITGLSPTPTGLHATIRITATPTGGGTPYVFLSHTLTIETPNSAPLSIYAVNDDFGDPTPAGATNANDFLIRRAQYVLSYNQSRGTPNWVSYELDARQMVPGQDRCNCFTADPLLPAAAQIFTSDYTNGGFDRGHMTRSADRTAGNVDNAITFYTTNVVPQQGDLNQGVWAQFENSLADSARNGRAVYIVTGPLYSRSHSTLNYVKNEGKIAIPDSTWKVALIGPGNSGNPFTHANVTDWSDLAGLTILAVNMPNIAGVRNDPPSKYFTTVEAIEEATGYDLFSILSASFTAAIEYHDHGPSAHFAISGTQNEGQQLTFDASASTDADLGRADLGRTEALTYTWHFSDGTDATGKVVTKTFANHGNYSAKLTVTDAFGWPAEFTLPVEVANLAPTAQFNAPPSGSEGVGYMISLSGGTDPSPLDAAELKYSFDCGAGYSAPSSASTATCTPNDQGEFTVHGKVIDLGGMFTEYSGVVNVSNVPPTATFSAPGDVDAGSAIALSLSGVVDPSTADVSAGFTFAFDCGDGTGYGATSATATASCPTSAASGSRNVRGRVFDKDGGSTEYTATVTVTRRLTALGNALVWIGLKNSDDVGLRIDLRTEVLVNGTVIGSAELSNIAGGSSGFNNAQLQTAALALANGKVDLPSGAQVSFRASVRRTCAATQGHNAGRVILWYNGAPIDDGAARDAGTRFESTVGGMTGPAFARLGSMLAATAGTARTTLEVQVNSNTACPNRPFSVLGAWSATLP